MVVGNWKRLEDFSRTDEQNLEVRRRLGIPDGAWWWSASRNCSRTGRSRSCWQAVEELPECVRDYRGQGSSGGAVSQQAAARNPRILFVGFVSGKQIADYTCAADVVYYGFDPAESERAFQRAEQTLRGAGGGPAADHGRFRRNCRRGARGRMRNRAAGIQRRRDSEGA